MITVTIITAFMTFMISNQYGQHVMKEDLKKDVTSSYVKCLEAKDSDCSKIQEQLEILDSKFTTFDQQ